MINCRPSSTFFEVFRCAFPLGQGLDQILVGCFSEFLSENVLIRFGLVDAVLGVTNVAADASQVAFPAYPNAFCFKPSNIRLYDG